MSTDKKFFWHDDPEIGSYKFCHGGIWDYDFYIEEVSVKYVYGWTEEKRQHHFNGAKFIWGGCADGVSYSNHPLKAQTIEDAKKEFEGWYEQYLQSRIDSLKRALAAAAEEQIRFMLYKNDTAQHPASE